MHVKVVLVPWREGAAKAAETAAGRPWIAAKRQCRWDDENMRTASCRLRKETMEDLRAECRAQGTTVYGLLRYMIQVYLKERRR